MGMSMNWNTFNMKKMNEHHNLYLKYDVLMLANVFEKFRNSSLDNFEQCQSHYLCSVALICDAILIITKSGRELISDSNMYLLFPKGTRVGVFYKSKKYIKPTVYICNLMTQNKNKNILYT